MSEVDPQPTPPDAAAKAPAGSTPESPAPATRPPLTPAASEGRSRRVVRGLILAIVLLVLGAAGYAYGLWCSKPAYWKQHEEFLRWHDQTTLQRLADDVERRVLNSISDQQGPSPNDPSRRGNLTLPTARVPTTHPAGALGPERRLHFSLEEINAWMAVRLPGWAANKNMPLPVTSSMMTIDGDRVIFAAQVDTPEVTQVFSAIVSVRLQPDGMAAVKIEGLRGGRLPLPKGAVASRLRTDPELSDRPEVQHLLAMFDGRLFDPVASLDSHRRLRVVAFKTGPNGVDLTLREEAKPTRTHGGTR